MTPSRPRKRVSAMKAPSGMPISAASATALRLTISDSRTIASKRGIAGQDQVKRGSVRLHRPAS